MEDSKKESLSNILFDRLFLPNGPAAVHHQVFAGYVRRGIGSQKANGAFDIVFICPAMQGTILNIGGLKIFFVGVIGKTGVKSTGGDAIDADSVFSVTAGHVFG